MRIDVEVRGFRNMKCLSLGAKMPLVAGSKISGGVATNAWNILEKRLMLNFVFHWLFIIAASGYCFLIHFFPSFLVITCFVWPVHHDCSLILSRFFVDVPQKLCWLRQHYEDWLVICCKWNYHVPNFKLQSFLQFTIFTDYGAKMGRNHSRRIGHSYKNFIHEEFLEEI